MSQQLLHIKSVPTVALPGKKKKKKTKETRVRNLFNSRHSVGLLHDLVDMSAILLCIPSTMAVPYCRSFTIQYCSTSVREIFALMRNTPEEQISCLHRGRSLGSHVTAYLQNGINVNTAGMHENEREMYRNTF